MSTEIVVAPANVWFADVGTTFPALTAAPTSSWTLIGSLGYDEYDEGVVITIEQSLEQFRGQGTAPVKVWRTERDVKVELAVADSRLEMFAAALGSTVSTGTGEATSSVPVSLDVKEVALLVRAINGSPYDKTKNIQYEFPRCAVTSSVELGYTKSGVTLVKFTFTAMRPTTGNIMTVRAGTP